MAKPTTDDGTSYTVLARKYRPARFSDLIGQPHVCTALTNAISRNRVAQAFLFTGSRGTGKTSTARILAAALNCPDRGESPEPCGKCPSCREIARSEDLDVVEMDAASNSRVDDIRERLESVDTRPARGHYRIYIIDEVHMLSTSAFNALLKTIEEPPAHVKFILATTNPEKIPETVLSRVQRYDFRRVTVAELMQRLEEICKQESIEPQEGLLRSLAELADGGVRDALSRLDQVVAFCGDKPGVQDAETIFGLVGRKDLLALLEGLAEGDARLGVLFAEDVFNAGKDVAEVLGALIGLTRNLLILEASSGEARGLDLPPSEIPELKRVAAAYGIEGLVYLAELLNDCRQRVRRAAFPRVLVETTFVKLAMIGKLEPLDRLLARLDSAVALDGPETTAVTADRRDRTTAGGDPEAETAAIAPKASPKTGAPGGETPRKASETEQRAVDLLRQKFGIK